MHLLIPAQGHPVTVVCHHWALAISNLFLRCVVIGQNGLVLPFPPFPNWKRKGPNKPEFNLFWQSSQSSYSKGGPAHRRGMILSHPGSRQRRPCFSLSVFSHVETYWPRCLPIRILMGKREKNPIFFFLRENERLSCDTRQQNVNLVKRKERKLFWLQVSKSLI